LNLSSHYGRSDALDKGLLYLEQAGDQARDQAAYDSAVGYYQEAVSRLDGLGRATEAARIREKLGAVLLTGAHFTQAMAVLEETAAALRLAGDVAGLGRVMAQIGRGHIRKGTVEEGLARLRPQLEVLTVNGPSHGLAVLAETLAYLYQMHGQFDAALAAAIRSAELARALGDHSLLARADIRRGVHLLFTGREEEALLALQEAGALAEAVRDLAALGRASQALALMAEDRGEFDLGRQYASRMLAATERLGDPVLVRLALFRLAAQAFFTGAWGEAHACMDRVRELPDRSRINDAAALIELGRLAMVEGEWEQATGYLEECSAIDYGSGERVMYLVAESLLAEREVLEARAQAALARLLPLVDHDGMQGRTVTIHVLPVLAWVYLELDDTDRAARTIAEALRRQRAGQYRFALVDALRVQALVAQRQGHVQTAVDALEEGLRLARAMPYPHGEGRLLAVYGRLHLDQGDATAARERLEAALAIFRRLGARRDIERTAQLLATLS
jgi:tetratricopeptide (TPR) repeat protein